MFYRRKMTLPVEKEDVEAGALEEDLAHQPPKWSGYKSRYLHEYLLVLIIL